MKHGAARLVLFALLAVLAAALLAPAVWAAPGDVVWSLAYPTDQEWTVMDARVAASSGTGDVFVASTIERTPDQTDWVVTRYTPAGARKWAAFYGGAGVDRVLGVAADRDGNVVVCGVREGATAGDTSFAVVKWTRGGARAWARRIDGSKAGGADEARAVVVDGAGNVYVAGAVVQAKTGSDILLVKYGPGGGLLWQRRSSTSGRGTDGAYELARDAKGRLYVAAQVRSVVSGQDLRVLRYRASGLLDWRLTWGNVDGDDVPLDMAVNATGLAVCGRVDRTTSSQGVVIKLGLDGKGGWRKTYTVLDDATAGSSWEAVGIDASGRVTVGGAVNPAAGGLYLKYWLHRFDAAGTVVDRYEPTGFETSIVHDLVVTGPGVVYTAGQYNALGGWPQGRAAAWNADWTPRFDVLHSTDPLGMSREDTCVLTAEAFYVAGIGHNDQDGTRADQVLTKYER